jgi:porin
MLVCLAANGSWAQTDESDDGAGTQAEPASEPGVASRHRWHLPRKRERDPLSHADPPPVAEDWNPVSGLTREIKKELRDWGVVLDVDMALYDQQASKTTMGDENLGTFTWQAVGDWRFLNHTRVGTSYVGWTLLGSTGFNYESRHETLSGNVGSISGLNSNVYPSDGALDELFWKQVSPNEKWILLAGRVDSSFYFDTNRAANNGYRQFFSFALENNLSIPWSTYGGIGALARFNVNHDLYVMASASSSASDESWAPWKSLDDNAWGQLLEIGGTAGIPGLGKGSYRLTPWHNHISGKDGFGVGLNFDQELGLDWLVAFFRFGIGDGDVTPVRRLVSGGLALERPFGRKDDEIGVGVAWSDPSSGNGARDETLVELYYRIELSPSIALTPDVQLVLDPAGSDDGDTVVVGGIRVQLRF